MMIQERITGREKRSKAGKRRIFTNYLGLNRTAAKNKLSVSTAGARARRE